MLFRQLSDRRTRALSYLIAARRGGEALLVDPVKEQVDLYLRLIEAFDLKLVLAVDTHWHPGDQSARELLLDQPECVTAMGKESRAECVARQLSDGERLDVDGLAIHAMHTPGHTEDSYCLVLDDRVFTGDTLLIRGTGRTDLGGDPRQQYHSLFGKLLRLPGRTLVFPGHEYNGRYASSIAEELAHNPRLQVRSVVDYVALMKDVAPSDARLMDVPEAPSLHPRGASMRRLLAVGTALRGSSSLPSSRA